MRRPRPHRCARRSGRFPCGSPSRNEREHALRPTSHRACRGRRPATHRPSLERRGLRSVGLEVANEACPIHVKGDAYARSKAAPERYIRKLQDRGAPISITYPTSVLGPGDPGLSEAMRGISAFFKSGVIITSSGFQLIDVRDLAQVHEQLISREPKAGRYLATAPFLPWEELADLLDRSAGLRLPRIHLPGRMLRAIGSIGDRMRWLAEIDPMMSREATRLATQWVEFDASAVHKDLNVTFRDPVETLRDTVRFLAEAGHIEKDRALRFTHPGRGRL